LPERRPALRPRKRINPWKGYVAGEGPATVRACADASGAGGGSTGCDGKSLANPCGGAYVGLVAFGSFPRHRPRSNRLDRRFDPGNQGGSEPTRGRMTAPSVAFLVLAIRSAQGVRGRKEGVRVAGRESCERGGCETMALEKGAPRMATRQCSAEFQGRDARVARENPFRRVSDRADGFSCRAFPREL